MEPQTEAISGCTLATRQRAATYIAGIAGVVTALVLLFVSRALFSLPRRVIAFCTNKAEKPENPASSKGDGPLTPSQPGPPQIEALRQEEAVEETLKDGGVLLTLNNEKIEKERIGRSVDPQ